MQMYKDKKENTAENIVPEALQYLCPNQNPSQESVQLVQPSKEYRNKCDADCINKLAPGAEANSSTSDRFLKTLAGKLNLNANIITLSESRKISSKKKKRVKKTGGNQHGRSSH